MPSVKINYDFGTVIVNNEELNIIKENLDLINHIHISEPNLEIIKKNRLHLELFAILKKQKYDKIVSIEMKQTSLKNIMDVLEYILEILGEDYGKEKY